VKGFINKKNINLTERRFNPNCEASPCSFPLFDSCRCVCVLFLVLFSIDTHGHTTIRATLDLNVIEISQSITTRPIDKSREQLTIDRAPISKYHSLLRHGHSDKLHALVYELPSVINQPSVVLLM